MKSKQTKLNDQTKLPQCLKIISVIVPLLLRLLKLFLRGLSVCPTLNVREIEKQAVKIPIDHKGLKEKFANIVS